MYTEHQKEPEQKPQLHLHLSRPCCSCSFFFFEFVQEACNLQLRATTQAEATLKVVQDQLEKTEAKLEKAQASRSRSRHKKSVINTFYFTNSRKGEG
jgi:hypothetical protein